MKAIALDIDGTITHENRQLDLEAVRAIRTVEEHDIPVILATGNILCYSKTTSTLVGTSGPIIAEDGGIVYDKEGDEEYVLGGLEEVERGIEVLEGRFPNLKHSKTSKKRKAGRVLRKTVDPEAIDRVFQEQDLDLVAVDSGFAIHIKTPNVSKGNALDKAAEILDCSVSEILVMGDGKNDTEMLEKAEHSYAPSNAHREVKKSAKYVTDNPYGKGVKEMIKKVTNLDF